MFEKGMPALTANGILGDPRRASAERGEVYLERLADFVVSKIGQRRATESYFVGNGNLVRNGLKMPAGPTGKKNEPVQDSWPGRRGDE